MKNWMITAAAGVAFASAASAQSLTTAPTNNQVSFSDSGLYFDLTSLSAELIVTDITTASVGAPDTAVTWDLWTRSGTYVGNENSSDGWTPVGEATGVVSGASAGVSGNLVDLDFADFVIPAGETVGIALFARTGGVAYQGNDVSVTRTFANDDLQLDGGALSVSGPFAGVDVTDRVFSGTINYIPAPGAAAVLGLAGFAAARRRR
jgi:uncharacterized protein (TIGR03382 family)